MAVTADEVQVRLEAATDRYVSDLLKADKTFATITKNMEKNAIAAGASFTRLGDYSVVGAKRAASAFSQIDAAAESSRGNVANIAAQFQDIGVTAAAGMNPVIIALQQGTQLSAVLNESLGRGISPVKALGAAFAQIVNPVSLATIAVVALGAAAIQYFTTLLDKGPAGEEELKKQDDVLRGLVDRWGDLVPAVKAYIEARDEATKNQEDREGIQIAIERAWDNARAAAEKARVEFAFAIQTLQQSGESVETITELQTSFNELAKDVRDGNATTEQAQAFQAQLAQVIQTSSSPAVRQLAGLFQLLTANINDANIAQQQFKQDAATIADPSIPLDKAKAYVAEQERINGLTRDQLQLENEVNRVKAEASRDDVNLSDEQALQIAKDRISAEERRKEIVSDTKADDKANAALERERDAVKDLIADLEFEASLIGLSNTDRAVEVALRQAGAEATDLQREKIEGLVRATAAENEKLKEAQELYDAIKGAADNALKGFLHDIAEGKSAGEAFGNLLDDILSKLIDFGVSTALNAIFPGLGTIAGKKAAGGPVNSGSSYLVGERGPEIFTPSSAGRITSNADMMSGGGQSTLILKIGDGIQYDWLNRSAQQSVQIVQAMTPPMIAQGSGAAAAKSRRDRVA